MLLVDGEFLRIAVHCRRTAEHYIMHPMGLHHLKHTHRNAITLCSYGCHMLVTYGGALSRIPEALVEDGHSQNVLEFFQM